MSIPANANYIVLCMDSDDREIMSIAFAETAQQGVEMANEALKTQMEEIDRADEYDAVVLNGEEDEDFGLASIPGASDPNGTNELGINAWCNYRYNWDCFVYPLSLAGGQS